MSTRKREPEATAVGPRADVPGERRRGRIAGAAGFVAVVVTLGALLVSARATPRVGDGDDPVDRARRLTEFHDDFGLQVTGLGMRAVGLLATVVVGLYLARAVIERGGRDGRWLRGLAVVAPVLLLCVLLVGFFGLRDVVDSFYDGPRSPARADALTDGSTALHVVSVAEIVAHVVFGAWLVLLALRALAVGLLTRVLGYWGAAAGVVGMVLPIGDTLFIGWLASVSFLAWGWWPGGVPRSWISGVAEALDLPLEHHPPRTPKDERSY
jgi:hypothetical protein